MALSGDGEKKLWGLADEHWGEEEEFDMLKWAVINSEGSVRVLKEEWWRSLL